MSACHSCFLQSHLSCTLMMLKTANPAGLKMVLNLELLHNTIVDAYTCAEFDDSGEYLAAGDKSGRIYVFNCSVEVIFSINLEVDLQHVLCIH